MTMKVAEKASGFLPNGIDTMQIIPSMFLFFSDFEQIRQVCDALGRGASKDISLPGYYFTFGFDMDAAEEEQVRMKDRLYDEILQLETEGGFGEPGVHENQGKENGAKGWKMNLNGAVRSQERKDFYGVYGGLFFLGVLLGIVFLFAAVLIMYYKQISEGYEDQSRFEIMRKVGMTRRDIRKSINSQILTVFFLPLLLAGLHLSFAFPIVRRLLLMFGLTNTPLLIAATAGSYLVFALFYVVVYRITSRAYYKIVS